MEIKKELRLTEVQQLLDITHVYPLIKKLIDKKICFVWEAMNERYMVKKENYVLLNLEYHNDAKMGELLNNWSRAPKQMELLLAYLHLQKTEGDVTQAALLKKSGASAAQLKGLTEKNILCIEKRAIDRIRAIPKNVDIDFEFSLAQQECSDAVAKSFESKQVCLLHGVTSSGKTQVYIKLIEKYPILESTAFLLIGFVGVILLVEIGFELNHVHIHINSVQKFVGILVIVALSLLYSENATAKVILKPVVAIGRPIMVMLDKVIGLFFWPAAKMIHFGKELFAQKPVAIPGTDLD